MKDEAALSYDEFVPPKKEMAGKTIGHEQCQVISEELVLNIKGQRFQRIELRITGTLEGWTVKEGPRSNYFTDGPDFVFTQSGATGQRFKGIARYEGSKGSGISLFFPENPNHWNGKLFVTAHGAGAYGAVRTLLPRDPYAGRWDDVAEPKCQFPCRLNSGIYENSREHSAKETPPKASEDLFLRLFCRWIFGKTYTISPGIQQR
jgi:hypothetical protein